MQDFNRTVKPSALIVMANRLSVEPLKLMDTLKATVFKGASNEELLALVVVSNEYHLNPFLREIYAFPGRSGGIVPIVPIDGWTRIVNRQENFDGVEFEWRMEDETNKPIFCTCILHIKGRSKPVKVTEWFDECYRKTEPWNTMPRRMLRHKAFMQAARVAFGLSGVYDEDEGKDQSVAGADIPTAPRASVIDVSTADTRPMPETRAEAYQQGHEDGKKANPRTPQDELATIVIEAGHTFDDFAKWGEANFTAMKWGDINSFEEVPKADALRFIRAQDGLLNQLQKLKEGAA